MTVKKQSKRTCMMGLLGGCIDPCDDCPNMLAVRFDEKYRPLEDTLCQLEQGSKECYKVACPECTQFNPRGTPLENKVFCEKYMKMFE